MPAINLIVNPAPEYVPQNSLNSCWAAVSASVLGWMQHVSLDMNAAAAQLGPYYQNLLQHDYVLPFDHIAAWANDAHFTTLPPTNITIGIIQNVLTANKPLIVCKGTGNPDLGHVVVVYRLVGDGSVNTNITFVDPAHGAAITLNMAEFGPQFENLAPPSGSPIYAQMLHP